MRDSPGAACAAATLDANAGWEEPSVTKKYDPLWEIVGHELPLQGAVEDVDALCPVCHVKLHLGAGIEAGRRFECGLCATVLEVDLSGDAPRLVEATEE